VGDIIRGGQHIDTAPLIDSVRKMEDLYTLTSVIDDVDFGISHVIHGETMWSIQRCRSRSPGAGGEPLPMRITAC
jgi:glutamyl/glutaminyl-tRNA synthetase